MECIILRTQDQADILCKALGRSTVYFSGNERQIHFYSPKYRRFGVLPNEKMMSHTELGILEFLDYPYKYGKFYTSFFIELDSEKEFQHICELIADWNPFVQLSAQQEGFKDGYDLEFLYEVQLDQTILLRLQWYRAEEDEEQEYYEYEVFLTALKELIPEYRGIVIPGLDYFDADSSHILVMSEINAWIGEQGFPMKTLATSGAQNYLFTMVLTPWAITVFLDELAPNWQNKFGVSNSFFLEVKSEDFLENPVRYLNIR